jgi:hypothetical protein
VLLPSPGGPLHRASIRGGQPYAVALPSTILVTKPARASSAVVGPAHTLERMPERKLRHVGRGDPRQQRARRVSEVADCPMREWLSDLAFLSGPHGPKGSNAHVAPQ